MEERHDLAKWLAGEMDEKELETFRSTPEYSSYEKIARYSAALDTPDFETEKILQQVMASKHKNKVAPLYRSPLFRVAALLAIALGLFFFLGPNSEITEMAANGKQHTVLLPDNSEVVLNSDSEIRYLKQNWAGNRSLELSGEAFFKVAKGQQFDVVTPLGKVTVLGTQFNVKVRGQRFEVECFEGKVWVKNGKNSVYLTKGKIIVSENGILLDASASPQEVPSWMLGEMRFISASLSDITAEMERNYNIKIEVAATSKAGTFSGSLPSKDLQKALLIICKAYGLNAKSLTNKVVLSANE